MRELISRITVSASGRLTEPLKWALVGGMAGCLPRWADRDQGRVGRIWRRPSARRPGTELLRVAYDPDVPDPVARDVEREDRQGDAVLLGHDAGLAVDRTFQERHGAGRPV